jgi:uncharacterized paraquat-inducible protein A
MKSQKYFSQMPCEFAILGTELIFNNVNAKQAFIFFFFFFFLFPFFFFFFFFFFYLKAIDRTQEQANEQVGPQHRKWRKRKIFFFTQKDSQIMTQKSNLFLNFS